MYTTRNGIKAIGLLVVMVFLLVCLSSCCVEERLEQHFGSDDWAYTSLPGEYEIWRINYCNITLVKKTSDSSATRVVESRIAEFCYNNSFIGVKRLSISCNDDTGKDFNANNLTDFLYYLVDVPNDAVFGPYTEDEYTLQVSELNVGVMSDWISTDIPQNKT